MSGHLTLLRECVLVCNQNNNFNGRNGAIKMSLGKIVNYVAALDSMSLAFKIFSSFNLRILCCESPFRQMTHTVTHSMQFVTVGYNDRYAVFILHSRISFGSSRFDLKQFLRRNRRKPDRLVNEHAHEWLKHIHHSLTIRVMMRGRKASRVLHAPPRAWRMHAIISNAFWIFTRHTHANRLNNECAPP